MDSPRGETSRRKEHFKQVRIPNMDSPEGETLQTERTCIMCFLCTYTCFVERDKCPFYAVCMYVSLPPRAYISPFGIHPVYFQCTGDVAIQFELSLTERLLSFRYPSGTYVTSYGTFRVTFGAAGMRTSVGRISADQYQIGADSCRRLLNLVKIDNGFKMHVP